MNNLQTILTKSKELKQLIDWQIKNLLDAADMDIPEHTIKAIGTMDDVYMALLKMDTKVAGLIDKELDK